MRDNVVLRPLPCHFYDVERMESWLQEQAAKGLFLTQWGSVFARFRRAEPAKVRYRITAARLEGSLLENPPEAPDAEQQELFSGEGWQFVTGRGELFVYLCSDPAAPELDTDPAVQALSLKMVRRDARITAVVVLLNAAMMAMNMGMRGGFFWLGTLVEAPCTVLLAALLFANCLLYGVSGWLNLRRLTRQLKQGIPLDHNKPWRAEAVRYRASVLGVLFLVVGMVAVATGWGEPTQISADEYGALPFATLTDLTGSDTVQEKTTLTAQGSVLAPCILHYDEDAYIGIAPCHLYVDYYQTAAPWMAQRLAKELHNLKKKMAPDPVAIPCPAGVDAAYAYDNEGVFEQVILVKGDTVMSALWFGEMPNRTEDFLPILAEKMQG